MTATTDITASPSHESGSYSGLPNLQVGAANGIDYAYRDTGPGDASGAPLVLLQRFRGNLDNWDPALIDALASNRRMLAFDNTGVREWAARADRRRTRSSRWRTTRSRSSTRSS